MIAMKNLNYRGGKMKSIFFKIGCILDKYLHWHSCKMIGNDGLSNIGICKYCGKECLQDSQGNWFAKKDY